MLIHSCRDPAGNQWLEVARLHANLSVRSGLYRRGRNILGGYRCSVCRSDPHGGQCQQGDPGRQSGRRSRVALVQQRRRGGQPVASRPRIRWKDKDGNRQERTEWHRVVIFNENLGRVAKQYLRKGSKVYLEGAAADPQVAGQCRPGQIFDRDRAPALPRRARACSTSAKAAAAAAAMATAAIDSALGLRRRRRRRARPAASRAPQPAFDSDLDDDVPF